MAPLKERDEITLQLSRMAMEMSRSPAPRTQNTIGMLGGILGLLTAVVSVVLFVSDIPRLKEDLREEKMYRGKIEDRVSVLERWVGIGARPQP